MVCDLQGIPKDQIFEVMPEFLVETKIQKIFHFTPIPNGNFYFHMGVS